MDLDSTLHAFVPSSTSVTMLLGFFAYLGIAGTVIPGKVVPGVILSDGTRLHYRCNGLLTLILLVALLSIGVRMSFISPTVTLILYVAGRRSHNQGSSLKPHVTGNLIDDWWFGIQLNPQFMGIDLKFFFVRAGMMGWLLINLSILAKSVKESNLSQSMILYQIFCVLYILDYFFYEEYMTSTFSELLGSMILYEKNILEIEAENRVNWVARWCRSVQRPNHCLEWGRCREKGGEMINVAIEVAKSTCMWNSGATLRWDIIAEKLGFMLVFGDLVWIPFTFSIQGWWLLSNKVELTTAAVIANCIVFLIGFSLLFEGLSSSSRPKMAPFLLPFLFHLNWEAIEFLEVLTSRSMNSKRTRKHQYGVDLQRLLGESCLLLATGKVSFGLYSHSSSSSVKDMKKPELESKPQTVRIEVRFLADCFSAKVMIRCLLLVPRPYARVRESETTFLWGIARHCNYLGDLLLAASFSLTCGIISPIPYFYPIYLLILLIWRERRDEARCAEKYREVWAEYCKLVPWRILPYAY
ncbi:hypothetical protein RHMOL_Rhmol03G0090000 [Rhododendron molle]|uniref:Uncharacterized protein n=1 Tax=Rhododendron molle TaxID=49168 RepID=A0ACC0PD83_RHOML|nr:hypothetical protein RHMOL_Rhmol03G0090000 [Rhododendron molle]